MTTNRGQLWPASNPVNWINKAKRPKTTSTTPNATLDPARLVVGIGATYGGGRGWYVGGGGGVTAVSVAASSATDAAASSSVAAGASALIAGDSSLAGSDSAAGAASVEATSELSTGLSLPGAQMSGLPESMSELTWTVGEPSLPSEGVAGGVSFDVERLRLVIVEIPYTASRACRWWSRLPPRSRQEVGQDPVNLWIQSQPDVAASDLDRVYIPAQASAPVHDAVGPRVDRGGGDSGRRREVAKEPHLHRGRVAVANDVVNMSGPNARHRQGMDVERIVERRPKRDDLFHELGLAVREHLREHPPAALAYQRHARAGAVVQVLQSVEERSQHDL